MTKKLAVVTFSPEVGRFYCTQLNGLFGDIIEVERYSFEDNTVHRRIDADLALISTYPIYETVKNYISDNAEIVIANITLSKMGLKRIMDIPSGTKVMLVNLSIEMAVETISLIYQLGLNHIEFVPVYPGMKEIPDLKIAVTPGETRHVPKNADEVIDVGHRLLDISTIVETAVKLDLDYMLQRDNFKIYFKSIATNSYSLEKLTGKTNRLESQFDILLKILDEGIIGVNADGLVYAYNEGAENIIGLRRDEVLGKEANVSVPQIPFSQVLSTSKPIDAKLIKINGCHVSVTVVPVIDSRKLYGAFAIFKRFKDTENQQHKLRAQLINKGHRAKHKFDDITGTSAAIINTKEIARKMAASDSSVLITGESGTGKELFAQAIHNESARRDYQFVAVNCAALPESLLESELFGYEEGAFTGARKGGKLGLFELAHMGTLFLDEIGEMNLSLQARLLRVIQEREVMRIGGDSVIDIDVRIIAATNRNLKELVEKGEFRKDLYFRLSVLPLKIPPLRERGEDVFLLMEEFKRDLKTDFKLTEDSKAAFLNHNWEGNVRELRNYIEYLTYLGKNLITLCDIPFSVYKGIDDKCIGEKEIEEIENFKKIADIRLPSYLFVLEELYRGYENKTRVGRRSIAKAADKKGIFLTEQEIRNMLLDLSSFNMVEIGTGRGGSKITQLGIKFLNKHNNMD